jgi:hypothetical protein
MAKRRSARSPKAKRQPAKAPTKRPRKAPEGEDVAHLLGDGEIIGQAYGFTSFPIRERETWGDAQFRANVLGRTFLRFADCFPGGVIAGFESGAALNYFAQRFAEIPADALYTEPTSAAKPPDSYAESERERADGALTIRSSVAIQDFIGRFVDLATLAATSAAMLVGIDEAANRPKNPESGTWWAMYRDIVPVRPVTDAERHEAVKFFSECMRDLLRNCLFDDGAEIGVAGRKPEVNRDHRAYCMRERLVHSPTSIYARFSQQERFRRAKRDVLTQIILRKTDDTCSDSNWTRIMGSGKSVHQRVAPDAPYCEDL